MRSFDRPLFIVILCSGCTGGVGGAMHCLSHPDSAIRHAAAITSRCGEGHRFSMFRFFVILAEQEVDVPHRMLPNTSFPLLHVRCQGLRIPVVRLCGFVSFVRVLRY